MAAFSLPFAFFVIGFSVPLQAQSLPNAPSELLNQLQQQFGGQGQGALIPPFNSSSGALSGASGPTQNLPQSLTLQPVGPGLQPPLPPSRLEQIMSVRAGARLQQFGYDLLGRGSPVTVPQTGAVQDDYVLGPGDEIIISLRGQENGEFHSVVDRTGQVVVPRLSPIPAMGRNFGIFRQDLEAAVHRAYVATSASISIGRVRQISVLVSGEVNSPGQRLLTGLSSVTDALLLSGGVKKTGSLRNIRVQRNGHENVFDLYSVLTGAGASSPFRLADGDRIIVPPLGRTVAVTGLVRQPGIFELATGQSSISARALLALSGGKEVQGRYRLSVMHIDQEGRFNLAALTGEAGLVHDSEILFLQLGADQTVSQATLSGGIGLAGSYPVVPGTKLSDVLKAPGAVGTSPYTLFGIIGRKDPNTLLRTLASFTPVAVLNGTEDQMLQTDDVIHPLTTKEARLLSSVVRLYVQRRDAAEQVLRNPLSDIGNGQAAQTQTASVGAQPGPQNVNPALAINSQRYGAQEAQDQESDIQLIGNLTQRQLDMIASNQVRLNDFRYLPEQSLGPGVQNVYLPRLPEPAAQAVSDVRQQTPSQNATAPLDGYGRGLPVPPQISTSSGQQGASEQNTYSANEMSANHSPAANFQEEASKPGFFPTNREPPTFNSLAQQLGVDPLILINFLMDHQVTLDGAVRGPGAYFIGPNVSLQNLVQAAGGTVNWADASGVELISTAVDTGAGHSATQRMQLPLRAGLFASYIVKPHDEFHFNQVYSNGDIGSVTIQGEVRFTGTYRIMRGDHLSDLLVRAGGLTGTAYPYGTVFLRKSAADVEHDGYIRAAKEVEDQLVVAMTRVGNDKIDPTTFASMQTFVYELRNQKAVGRISVAADPSVLAAKPELDPLLEAGDVVYIPQRPSTVAVLGQVSQPGSFPYRSGLTLGSYIEQAGGYSATADEAQTFIVLPDGSARRIQKSWLSFDANNLPPGSTIVVPRDVTPLDTRQLILDVSSIFSQLAVSIASVAVISR
jgi:protein involved in polysaccharide export with SLBB domain